MLKTRIIPCLSLINDGLVKTVRFNDPAYIGDPINTVRIFNELEVDELCFLDIRASVNGTSPNIALLKQIANECFMPLSYGGGINTFETAQQVFAAGFEKIVINTAAHRSPGLIAQLAAHYGSQAVIAAVDVRKNIWGKYVVYINDGTEKLSVDIIDWVKQLEILGAGELLITSMDKDGTWSGYEVDLIKKVSAAVKLPVIANGGAGNLAHIKDVVKYGAASAAALGSMVVYQKQGMGVLVSFPDKDLLQEALGEYSIS